MKKIIYDTAQQFTAWLQSATESYERHNGQYEEPGKLEVERAFGQKLISENAVNGPEMRTGELLNSHPDVKNAVDIGSGTGWCSASLSPLVDSVTAIEPSEAAIKIAKELYPAEKYANISWINGLAEIELNKIKIAGPTIFVTGCVLSHIRDKEVIEICKAMNSVAPKGSVLTFAECWGDVPWHQLMWHVRTKAWWQQHLPDWELTFHGPQVSGEKYNKGFWGVKIR